MKTKFENSIKESLEQFELPYDASAWTALSQKLDVLQPVSAPKSNLLSTNGKWFLAAGIVTIAATITYFVSRPDTTVDAAKEKTVAVVKNNSNQTGIETTTSNGTNPTKINSNQSEPTNSTDKSTFANQAQKTLKGTETKESTTSNSENSSANNGSSETGTANQRNEQNTNGNGNRPSGPAKIIVPFVSDICLGETISIKNDNTTDLVLYGPSKEYTLKKNSSNKLEFSAPGKYEIISNGQEIASFYVNSLPKLDFTIDYQNQFEDGLPTTKVQTFSDGNSFTWNSERTSKSGKATVFHFFTKGTHDITLKGTSDAGCKAEISKAIEISSDYNLFAPNAFEPSHHDPRRNRFIPNALLVRDTPFTMIIVDPKTGVTLFTTTNAEDGWDGIDRNTGELVDENTYVWKVFLKKPIAGEKSEYSGTVYRK